MKPNKEAAKKKLKEKMAGMMMRKPLFQPYSDNIEIDPRTTKADAIEDAHAEKRYQEMSRVAKKKKKLKEKEPDYFPPVPVPR